MKINKPLKMCRINDREILCSVDLGSDCSIIKESEARLLNLKFKETNEVLSGFDHSLVVQIAYSKINLIIDDIELEIKIFIVPDDQCSRRVLIGRIKARVTDSSSNCFYYSRWSLGIYKNGNGIS